jgi:signal transduction histidine kinase
MMKETAILNKHSNHTRLPGLEGTEDRMNYTFIKDQDLDNMHASVWNVSASNLTLAQLVDLNSISPLFENLSEFSQVPYELVDNEGKILNAPLRMNICDEFNSKQPDNFTHFKRNYEIIKHVNLESGYQEFTYQNGLTDIVIPIHIHGKLLGAFFLGPIFRNTNETAISSFKQQLIQFGFGESTYHNAMEGISILSEDRTLFLINTYLGFIQLIKSIALRDLAITIDIEERRKQDTEILEAKRRAEESDKLKSAFLANMSHEIRTPMNSIIGFSELLTRENLDEEDKLSFISIIKESGQVLLELIDDIIDLSRIESNQVALHKRDFNVNEMLSDLLIGFTEQSQAFRKSHIELILDKTESESLLLFSDQLRIKQILTNLLRNAYKFSDQGPIQFGCTKQKDELIFYVKDSGMGISKEQQEFIFDRFRQGENDLSRKFGGAGLGLSIARDLCSLLGGKIWLESKVNAGSIFYFSLKHELNGLQQDSSNN